MSSVLNDGLILKDQEEHLNKVLNTVCVCVGACVCVCETCLLSCLC